MRAPVHSARMRGAAHRFDRDNGGPRGDVRQRIAPACARQPVLPPLHDRVGLGMQRNALAGRRHDLERFEHGAGGRRGDLAERVAHVKLEADDAAVDELGDMSRSCPRQADRRGQNQRTPCLAAMACLAASACGGAGRRNGVRHIEHRGDAAERGRRGPGPPILLVRIARIAEMHVDVDGAGKDVQAGRVESSRAPAAWLRRRRPRARGRLDGDAAGDHRRRGDTIVPLRMTDRR